MLSKTKCYRGYTCAEVFSSQFGMNRADGMRSKGLAHDALSHLFKTEGVPPEMVMDGSKEQNIGSFSNKLRDAGCHEIMT